MITAASNFSHLIQYTKAPEHSLVRTGIYGWSRHPSYFAFFYWALASQVFIGNPVSFVVFSVVLYRFFSSRIKSE
jgi:protein-S-isoprenylcysteine O-methyltransferase